MELGCLYIVLPHCISITVNALLSRVALRDLCMRLEPPLFPTLKISYDRQQSRVMLGLPVVCRLCYSCKTVCQGVIRYFASLVRFFW